MSKENLNGLDVTKLDGASRKYYEAMQRADDRTTAMLKRLVAEKQARESLETADAPLDKKPHE